MNDRAATGGIDHRRILLDPVERFHLGAPTVRPGRDADILAREQRRDLVGFVGVVKGADPETELARNVDHHRHFIGAIAVILDENLALQHPCRSEEHTSELQSLMRISYAVLCLKKKTTSHYCN